MGTEAAPVPAAGPASLVVVDPNGHRKRVPVDPIPFLIGRQPENHLILRDSLNSHGASCLRTNGPVNGLCAPFVQESVYLSAWRKECEMCFHAVTQSQGLAAQVDST